MSLVALSLAVALHVQDSQPQLPVVAMTYVGFREEFIDDLWSAKDVKAFAEKEGYRVIERKDLIWVLDKDPYQTCDYRSLVNLLDYFMKERKPGEVIRSASLPAEHRQAMGELVKPMGENISRNFTENEEYHFTLGAIDSYTMVSADGQEQHEIRKRSYGPNGLDAANWPKTVPTEPRVNQNSNASTKPIAQNPNSHYIAPEFFFVRMKHSDGLAEAGEILTFLHQESLAAATDAKDKTMQFMDWVRGDAERSPESGTSFADFSQSLKDKLMAEMSDEKGRYDFDLQHSTLKSALQYIAVTTFQPDAYGRMGMTSFPLFYIPHRADQR